jgi:ribonucleoside-diphosphate reductase alpha chain
MILLTNKNYKEITVLDVCSIGLHPTFDVEVKKNHHYITRAGVVSHNTGIFANLVTGGIEPAFMPEYIRTSIVHQIPDHIISVTPKFYEGVYEETSMFKWVKEGDDDILRGTDANGVVYKIDKSRGLTKETLCEDYGVWYLKQRGEWDPTADYAVTTTELTVEEHVSDLLGFAKRTDSACSKTANIPHDYPYENFKNLYLDVYNTGVIKGFTTYRAGTMASVLSAKEEANASQTDEEIILDDVQMPASLPATLKTIRSEGRKWYLTIIQDETQTRPVALFVQTNSHEKSITANDAVEKLTELAYTKKIPSHHIESVLGKMSGDTNATKICRMISLNLRHGVLIKNIVSTLENVDCFAGSFVFHIRKYLGSFIKDGEPVQGETCPECGSEKIVFQQGCKQCSQCSYSKCG